MGSADSAIANRIRTSQALTDHVLVGEEVVVPNLSPTGNESGLEYAHGTIKKVHSLSGDEPDILTVQLEPTGEFVHVDLTAGWI